MEAELKQGISLIDNLDDFSTPEIKMSAISKIDEIAGMIDKRFRTRNNKELSKLATGRPKEYYSFIRGLFQDGLYSAKNPELKLGMGTKELKKLPADEILEQGRNDTGNILDRLSGEFTEARNLRKLDSGISLKDKMKSWFLDRFAPAEKVDKNFYENLRLLAGGGKARVEQLITERLGPILKNESDRLEGFSQYLALERMGELVDERGLKRSLTSEEIQRGFAELEKKYGSGTVEQMRQSAQQLRAFLDETLDMAVQSGLISEESANAARTKNQYYITFETLGQLARQAGDEGFKGTNSFNVAKQNVLKRIGESETGIADPLESTLAKVMNTIEQSDKNSILKRFVQDNPDTLKKLAANEDVAVGKGKIDLFVDGKKVSYEVPKGVEIAVKNLNAQGTNIVLKILNYPVRVLKAGAVAFNAEFFVVNPVRDVQDALIGEASQKGFKESVKILSNYSQAFAESVKMGDLWAAWRKSGGGQSTFLSREIASSPEVTVKELAGLKKTRFLGKLSPTKIFDFLSRTTEESTRISKFRKDIGEMALKETESLRPFADLPSELRRAAFESREITLDFGKMGTISRVLNQVIPFFNVSVIGSEKFIKLAKNNPAQFAKSMAVYAGIPALILHLYNRQYGDYQDIADYEKESNLLFMVRDRTEEEKSSGAPVQAFKLPMGNLAQPFFQTVNSFLTFAEKRDPSKLGELAANLIEGASPVGFPVDSERARRTLSEITPQGLKTPVEIFANRNLYTGYQVEPDWIEGERRTDIPAEYRVSKYTGPSSKLAGKLTGKFGLSPAQFENAIGTNLGGLGKQILTGADTLFGSPPGDASRIPVVRRLYAPRGGQIEKDQREAEKKVEKEKIAAKLAGKPLPVAKEASAAEELPTLDRDIVTLYEQSQKTLSQYADKSSKARLKGDDITELQDEVVEAQRVVKQIEKEKPELIFEQGIQTYSTGGRKSVEERAKWVVDQLKKADTEEAKQELIKRFWDENVLTAQKGGVAQYIYDNYDIDTYKKVGKGGSKKAKVLIDFKKLLQTSKGTAPVQIKGPKISIAQSKPVKLKSPKLPEFSYKGKSFSLKA